MILVEPELSATNAQISASEEPITMQPPNMQRFPLTVWQRCRPQARLQSEGIKITSEEVTDYSDEDEDTIVIAWSKVEEQFNSVKEFPNLFPKTIPTKLPPLRDVNHCIDPKPGSEWLLLQECYILVYKLVVMKLIVVEYIRVGRTGANAYSIRIKLY